MSREGAPGARPVHPGPTLNSIQSTRALPSPLRPRPEFTVPAQLAKSSAPLRSPQAPPFPPPSCEPPSPPTPRPVPPGSPSPSSPSGLPKGRSSAAWCSPLGGGVGLRTRPPCLYAEGSLLQIPPRIIGSSDPCPSAGPPWNLSNPGSPWSRSPSRPKPSPVPLNTLPTRLLWSGMRPAQRPFPSRGHPDWPRCVRIPSTSWPDGQGRRGPARGVSAGPHPCCAGPWQTDGAARPAAEVGQAAVKGYSGVLSQGARHPARGKGVLDGGSRGDVWVGALARPETWLGVSRAACPHPTGWP